MLKNLAVLLVLGSSSANAADIQWIEYNSHTRELRARIEYSGEQNQEFRVVTSFSYDRLGQRPILEGDIVEVREEGIPKKEKSHKKKKKKEKKKQVANRVVKEVVFIVEPSAEPVYFHVLEPVYEYDTRWVGDVLRLVEVIGANIETREELRDDPLAEGAATDEIPRGLLNGAEQEFVRHLTAEGCSAVW